MTMESRENSISTRHLVRSGLKIDKALDLSNTAVLREMDMAQEESEPKLIPRDFSQSQASNQKPQKRKKTKSLIRMRRRYFSRKFRWVFEGSRDISDDGMHPQLTLFIERVFLKKLGLMANCRFKVFGV